jgi:hypothetical protein
LSEVYKTWHNTLSQIPRLSRYTIGAKIDTLFCDVLELILLASYSPRSEKMTILQRASAKFDALKFFITTAWELKILDTKKYTALATPLSQIGKMLGGWMSGLKTKAPDMSEAL